MNENTNATVTKRRGRPKKVVSTPTTPATETQKISDIVSRNVKAATKEKGSPLTREELTQACLTPKDMIDEHGVFMGEDYAKILKKPHSAEELELIANKYQYDPVKDRMLIRIYFFDELLAVEEPLVPTFSLKRFKTQKEYYAFCTPEASFAILKYLKHRLKVLNVKDKNEGELDLSQPLFGTTSRGIGDKLSVINDNL